MDENVKKIMAILNDEIIKEEKCYKITLEDLKKIRNPIKRFRAKRALNMFMHHKAALIFAFLRIEDELHLKD